jgi:hypothetical protein
MHGYSLASASIVATKIILKSKFSIAAGLVKTNHFKNGLRTKMKGLKRNLYTCKCNLGKNMHE